MNILFPRSSQVTTCTIVGGVISIAVLVLYRLYFHPLKQYPGPILARITDWYAAFYAWKGSWHSKILELHEQYGDTIRLGPNSISINSKIGLTEIYGVRANVRKTESYAVMSASRHSATTASCRDKKIHSPKRKILAQVFTDQALKGVENHIVNHVREFCKQLGQKDITILSGGLEKGSNWGDSRDIGILSDHLTYDVMSSLCYGESFNLLGSPNLRHIPDIVSLISRRNLVCFVQPFVWKFKLDHIFMAKLSAKARSFGTMIKDLAKKRSALGCKIEQKDCFYYMLNAKDPESGRGFSEKELWCESLQLIIAGSDTTGVAISSVFFYLLHNPEALKRATEEVRSQFASEDDIRAGSQLQACKYLRACIMESLRMSPPGTNMPPREVLSGGLNVGGHHFPEGITIGTPIYALHHNESYFPDSFSYKPERWIMSSDNGYTEESVQLAQSVFSPFSVGPRSCVAKNLAWMEISITVARTLYLYDMRLDPRHAHRVCEGCVAPTAKRNGFEYQLQGWMTSARVGPMAQFKKACEVDGKNHTEYCTSR